MYFAEGIKWVISVNRSTTTKIKSYLLGVMGIPKIKFMLISSQRALCIGRGA